MCKPKCRELIISLAGGGAHLDFRNKKGMTPLHVAVVAGNTEAIKVSSGQLGINGHVGLHGQIGLRGQMGRSGQIGLSGQIGINGQNHCGFLCVLGQRVRKQANWNSKISNGI